MLCKALEKLAKPENALSSEMAFLDQPLCLRGSELCTTGFSKSMQRMEHQMEKDMKTTWKLGLYRAPRNKRHAEHTGDKGAHGDF